MKSSYRFFSHGKVLGALARFFAGAALLCAANLPRISAQTTWSVCTAGYVLCTVTGVRVGIGTPTPSATLGLNNSLASTSDFPTSSARQLEINDTYTNTGSGQDATVSIYSQAAATSNSSSADISLLVDNDVPSTETVNFGNKFGIVASSVFNGTGTAGTIAGGRFLGSLYGSGTPALFGSESVGLNSGSGTATSAYGTWNAAENSGSGTVTTAYGSFNEIQSTGSGGKIDTAYALYADIYKANGTVTNGYGLYLGTIGGTNHYGIYQSDNSNNYFAGNVGIGTTSPVHPLQVAGTIGAQEVIVSATGADYVFEPGYRLAPLTEVAAYVKENHHLPEIPSAKEVEERGVSLGEMQSKLLAKIEELTLHMIQAEEENQALRKRVAMLEEKSR